MIVPITEDILGKVIAAERADGHFTPLRTHAFVKNGEIIGDASLFAPTAIFWSKTDNHASDTFRIIKRLMENARVSGQRYLVACSPTSPIYPFMPRLGFINWGGFELFLPET